MNHVDVFFRLKPEATQIILELFSHQAFVASAFRRKV